MQKGEAVMANRSARLVEPKAAGQQKEFVHRLGRQSWIVDSEAAGQVMGWVRREAATWRADLEAMATHFPHWALVGGSGSQAARCRCGGPLAPAQGALRCVLCGKAGRADTLMWVGHVPVLARPEATFGARRRALQAAGFGETEIGGLVYLLVPLVVVYPSEWPSLEPAVYYAPTWLATLELPLADGRYHVIGGGRACLFGWGQWRPMSIAAVLQQRVVNHVVSLLKIAAGMSPDKAFIGRVAH
jgi:hypothetical protein